ncbi:hypothetical protein [Neobacillus cucumis]|uniref:hypothetical protein n=1 Tax=Neobacillus cucumis TaxID=1740721 RepID=UPI001962F343|nr:hypothetical protein [Neobacillus cucumis]MBM7656427.1 hypothetical protein [Neobacillus cucumis]
MIVELYQNPKNVKVNGTYRFDYIVDDISENFEAIISNKKINTGDILTVIAKVKSKKFISGFGYIFYDDEIEQCSEIDVSFCD